MAAFPELSVEDLAEFSGEDESAYERAGFAAMALKQAKVLFKLSTCLTEEQFPDNVDDVELATFALLDMANAIYWVQPFQAVLRNPFSSETIGSYSYSKLSTAVSAGLPTGVSWFDIATGRLSVCEANLGLPFSGGYSVFEENKEPHDGYGVYLGPGDQYPDTWGPDTYKDGNF